MPVRELPESLASVLTRAVERERDAAGLHRERQAITATSALLLAACDVGWTQAELATHLDMKRQTVSARVVAARLYGDARPALIVDAPTDPPQLCTSQNDHDAIEAAAANLPGRLPGRGYR